MAFAWSITHAASAVKAALRFSAGGGKADVGMVGSFDHLVAARTAGREKCVLAGVVPKLAHATNFYSTSQRHAEAMVIAPHRCPAN